MAMTEVKECLHILDAHLDGRSFLVGEFGVVDAHVNSLVDWLRFSKVDMAAYPQMNAWSKRCSERPAYKRLMSQK
jgi:glutathione S-transferase